MVFLPSPRILWTRLRSFTAALRWDHRGNVAMIVALSIFALVGAAALAIDVMSFYRAKRILQTATDLAAIAAASDPANGTAAANATLAANNINAQLLSLTPGTYTANLSIPPAQRFTPGGATPNAVALQTQTLAPLYFASVFNALGLGGGSGANGVVIGAHADATSDALASFAIGSRLAALNAGLLNSLLSALTGSTINLSLVDYNSLASANVDLFAYLRALSTQANLNVADYNSVLSTQVSGQNALSALASLAGQNITPAASAALQQIAAALPTTPIVIGNLASPGPYGNYAVGSVPPVTMNLRALDVLNGIAGLASNGQQVNASLATDVPGLTAQMSLAIGEPAQMSALGAPPVSASDAQVHLQVTFGINVPGLATAQVPVTITAARAVATLTSVSCPFNDPSGDSATINVTPSVATASIGTLANFTNFSDLPTIEPAQILNVLGLVSVSGSANASLGGTVTTPVTFTEADVQAATVQTVSSSQLVGSITTTLIGNLQLNVQTLGLNLGLGSSAQQALTTALAGVASPMDSILSGLMGSLGVGLGQADVWTTNIVCGNAVLVN
jgi:uncharacterized membrane protein